MELVSVNKKDSKDLIYKSNSLVNSKYNITVVQARFIAFISSFINAYDEPTAQPPNLNNFNF